MALDERDEDLRGLAIAALGRMPCRLTLELLTELLYSPLAMVRAQAVSALAAQHGVGRAFLDHHDLLGMLRLSIASPLQSVRTETVQEVRELFAHLRSGTSPTELRLDRRIDPAVPWLCRLRESYLADDPQSPHFDVTSLLALTGFEREWVERLLITFLPRDRRAIEALVQLGARRALPALAELLQRAGRTDAAELSAAVAAISRA
jgi:HEAT repeat protein